METSFGNVKQLEQKPFAIISRVTEPNGRPARIFFAPALDANSILTILATTVIYTILLLILYLVLSARFQESFVSNSINDFIRNNYPAGISILLIILSAAWHSFSDWYRLHRDTKCLASDASDPWASATSEMDFSALQRAFKREGEARAVRLPEWIVNPTSTSNHLNRSNSRNPSFVDRGGLQIVLLELDRDSDVEILRVA
ncbi:hypothetical protein SeMB42_g03252 [Synchytrium endobioticum]|uniref:Uncharacterized protein n=1 Tax=Synchytrium endobioticum TaxID=286115 RepID=A0A507CVF1_9FUNG|nr:hypothetical protein SeLEV6574_g05285 [Synchytrium endobioticum]TPX47610.1 hypothetical protein SeMB42_g03252 [Synchytrium endobioticum]